MRLCISCGSPFRSPLATLVGAGGARFWAKLSKSFRALAWRGFNPVAVEHERSKSKPSARIRPRNKVSRRAGA
eukprot:scaffold20748_cov56-Phaeocystis_antarctica.AAC.3